MNIEAKIVKQVFAKDIFRIFGCVPLKEYKDLQLNDYGSFTITGDLPYLDEGSEYTFKLDKGQSNKYGTQYKVLAVPSIENMEFNDQNEYEYLCNITTPSQARYVNNAYPNFIRLIINGEEDKIDVKNIYNVKDIRFAFLKREINEKYKYFKMVTDLKEYEITMAECRILGSEYKTIEDTIEQTKTNPYYTLIKLLDRNFMSVDKLLSTIHPELRQSETRTEFLILYALEQNEYDGNSRIHARDMAKKAIEIAPECVSMLKTVAVSSELIYYDEPTNDMAIMSTYLAECEIAQFVKEKIANSNELNWDWKKYRTVGDFSLTDTQMGLLENFCKHNISLLVGNSGSGKSSCTVALVNMLEENKLTYKLLCPTGKASKRLAECTDRETSTIHRLCASSREQGIWADVIIVDEISMVDIPTIVMLIHAINNNKCRVVFVGDDSQLMSIGVGNVFFDLINSNVLPITKLTEIFRYKDNGSLFVATNVRQGIQYLSNEPIQKFGKNFTFIQSNNCFKDLISAYIGLIDKGISSNDILCLSPYNVGSEGTYYINNVIQSKINPPIPNEKNMSYTRNGTEITFRVGSRVINKKNDYSAILYDYWEEAKREGVRVEDCPSGVVFNGDEGIVTMVDDEKMVVKFDNDFIVFTRQNIGNLLLSWCISVHSSQGSESEYVINISSPSHKRMLNRNLIYVSNTRSKGKHIEIGDIKTINDALKIAGQHERNTFLQMILMS